LEASNTNPNPNPSNTKVILKKLLGFRWTQMDHGRSERDHARRSTHLSIRGPFVRRTGISALADFNQKDHLSYFRTHKETDDVIKRILIYSFDRKFACFSPNSLTDYRNFGSFLRTPLVHSLQGCQSFYNGCQSFYNLTRHNIRIHSYLTYLSVCVSWFLSKRTFAIFVIWQTNRRDKQTDDVIIKILIYSFIGSLRASRDFAESC